MAWLVLAYRLPREPSAPRVAVWRALQRLGGAFLLDGVYVLERGAAALVAVANLAHDIRNFGGEASVLHVTEVDDVRHLRARLAAGPKPRKRARR